MKGASEVRLSCAGFQTCEKRTDTDAPGDFCQKVPPTESPRKPSGLWLPQGRYLHYRHLAWLRRSPAALITLGRRAPFSLCTDRKSTRLNSSHLVISYAVFCLKKKNKMKDHTVAFI